MSILTRLIGKMRATYQESDLEVEQALKENAVSRLLTKEQKDRQKENDKKIAGGIKAF